MWATAVTEQMACVTSLSASRLRAQLHGPSLAASAVLTTSLSAVEPVVVLAMPVVVVPAASDQVLPLPVVEHHLNPPWQ